MYYSVSFSDRSSTDVQPEITPGPAGPAANAASVVEMWAHLITNDTNDSRQYTFRN